MLKIKAQVKIISILLCLVLGTSFSYAIGLQYPLIKTPILFEPNKVVNLDFNVAKFSYDAEIHSGGELEQYLEMSKSKDDSFIKVRARLTLPDRLDPGMHTIGFYVTDILPPGEEGVGAKTAVTRIVPILVLSDTKFVSASLLPSNINEGEEELFNVQVKSLTTMPINDVWARLDIYDKDDQFLKSVKTNSISLTSYEEKTVNALVSAKDLKKGTHRVAGEVFYDGKSIEIEGSFRVGALSVAIHKIPTIMVRNAINKFQIEVENEWNMPLNKVYAEVTVADTTVTTPTKDLEPWKRTSIDGFIELPNVVDPETDIEVVVQYIDQTGAQHEFSKEGIVKIVDELESEEIEPEIESPASKNATYYLIAGGGALILILLLLNVFWIIKSMKKKE